MPIKTNNGYSSVLSFTYGKECFSPQDVQSQVIDPFKAKILWTPTPDNTSFEVQYREKTPDNSSQWYFKDTAVASNVLIKQLKPQHTYEYKVKGLCGTISSSFSDLYEFTTAAKPADTAHCGNNGSVPPIDPASPPLEHLYIGDVINNSLINFLHTLSNVKKDEILCSSGYFIPKA